MLLHSTMLLYLTDLAPFVITMKNWVEEEFQEQQGWLVEQVKLIDNIFFLMAFANADDRDAALKAAPWFMFRSFILMATWNPDFDIHKDFQTKIPILIQLPY